MRLPNLKTLGGSVFILSLLSLCATFFYFLSGRGQIFYKDKHWFADHKGPIHYWKSKYGLQSSYSIHRKYQANVFLNTVYTALDDARRPWAKMGDNPSMCGVFLAVAREGHPQTHSLELSLGSALSGITTAEREDVDLRVYFANTNASDHGLWQSPLLELVDRAVSAEDVVPLEKLKGLVQLEQTHNFATKAGLDFSYALQHCYDNSTAPFIALFEGDILMADGWVARVRLGLDDIIQRTRASREYWMDMSLFSQQRSLGFVSSLTFRDNIPYIIILVSATVAVLALLVHRITKDTVIPTKNLLIIYCVSILVFVLLFLRLPKYTLFPNAPSIRIQQGGSSIQGLVFPRKIIPRITEELRLRTEEGSPDQILAGYAGKKGLHRFVLDPVMVQHVGFDTVLSPGDGKAMSTAFEELDTVVLAVEHERMVAKVYGGKG